MRCPSLDQLPLPPADRAGWPWTDASPQLPDTMPDGSSWPRISIITPSCNQGQFIEETIRSVLLQGYPDLEYIIVDGGSTDASVDIIRRYEPWLAYWVSEPDRGQSHALNKGFAYASGEILAWLNSDDYYEPGAVARAVEAQTTSGAVLSYGRCSFVSGDGQVTGFYPSRPMTFERLRRYWAGCCPPQPTVFFRGCVYEQVGPVDQNLSYAMDYDLWLRILAQHEPVFVDKLLAAYRVHAGSKTSEGWKPFELECARASWRHWLAKGLIPGLTWCAAYVDHKMGLRYPNAWRRARRLAGVRLR